MVDLGILRIRYLGGGAVSDQDEALQVVYGYIYGTDGGPISTVIVVLPIGNTTT